MTDKSHLSKIQAERMLLVFNYLYKNNYKKAATVNDFLRQYFAFFKDDKYTVSDRRICDLEKEGYLKSYKFKNKKYYRPTQIWEKRKIDSILKKLEVS